jgi:S1-C subfamily serine protease
MEVDTYNLIVQQYNLTSATISRPVYLSYLFREGTVRHGWRLVGSVKVGTAEERFSIEELDVDSVRFGTRPNDRDINRRRDKPLEITVGTERLIQQLVRAADRVYEKVALASRGLRIEVRADLLETEQNIVASALFPFSNTAPRRSTEAAWANDVIQRLVLPTIQERASPAFKISPPHRRPRDATPEVLASFYTPAVALITSGDGATGSGALISGDGLILTAAHVVRAEPIHVVFPRGGDGRKHLAKLVFVNGNHDVALLRLSDYRSDRWFEVGLSESAAAGEPVVAIGNPSIGGGQVTGAISSGIVAKPYDSSRSDGPVDLIADIAVASGSSGGPLVSRRTGRIVGVVTAVMRPSISADFASSGYWALAAPSGELGKWLGLTYGP